MTDMGTDMSQKAQADFFKSTLKFLELFRTVFSKNHNFQTGCPIWKNFFCFKRF